MTAIVQKLTFREYLLYQDGSDTQYELVDGELMPMGVGTGQHGAVAKFLERTFDEEIGRTNQPWTAQKFAVGIRSPRGGGWDTCRIPDVTVLPLEQWQSLERREAIIELKEPAPLLVVEVVSQSTQTTDYRGKRSEYAVLGIPEYWIVDPLEGTVTICTLLAGFYDAVTFQGEETIISATFPGLQLKVSQILSISQP